jgi:tetratricopeptide (TPR) repeat protein
VRAKGLGKPKSGQPAEAELLILRGLSKEPDSPKWLQLQARLDLLRWRYDRAIATLERLEKTHSGSPSILLDLGNAYLLRGMHQEKSTDLQKAVEYLSGGMRRGKNPSEHRLALFNRAIALEQLHLWEAAEGDWKQYLQLDSASGWASEGRDRLRRIGEEEVLAQRAAGLADDPAAFLAESDRHAPLSTEAAPIARSMGGWRICSVPIPQRNDRRSGRRLAEIIVERHQTTG